MSIPVLLGAPSRPPLSEGGDRTRGRIALLGTNGNRLTLYDGRIKVLPGVEGLDELDADLLEDRASGIHGSFHRGVDIGPRDVYLPVELQAGTAEALSQLKADVTAVTNPLAGPVRVEVTFGTQTRWVEGYRTGRAPVWSEDTWSGQNGWQRTGLLIHCSDPWARSTPIVKTWTLGTVYNWFPIFPLQLSDSEVLGNANLVFVPGDAPPFPRWDITGPLTSVVATNTTTGRSWEVSEPLTGGQSLSDLDGPRNTYVLGADGLSAWSALEPPFDLWPLEMGANSVELVITGVTAATSVTMTADPLWSSLL